jgi:hypothetical protein
MSSSEPKSQELQVEAYKILVSQLQNDDNLFWRRNDVLIAINGGMLTVIGLMLSSRMITPSLTAVSIAICAIGVVVCVLWLLIAKRSEAFYNHWYEQLKFIERQYLTPVRIFQIADEYFSKGYIILGKEHFKLDFLSRSLHMFTAMQILAVIFSIVWFCLGIFLLFYS